MDFGRIIEIDFKRCMKALWTHISWIIASVVLFFAIPAIQSIIYSFSQMTITEDGVQTVWVGLKNYNYIINEHTDYLNWLSKSVTNFSDIREK